MLWSDLLRHGEKKARVADVIRPTVQRRLRPWTKDTEPPKATKIRERGCMCLAGTIETWIPLQASFQDKAALARWSTASGRSVGNSKLRPITFFQPSPKRQPQLRTFGHNTTWPQLATWPQFGHNQPFIVASALGTLFRNHSAPSTDLLISLCCRHGHILSHGH
ncbi:hypothetical protein B0H12DRAFT_1140886 [Mycena haematopus]|nr:hypothetical protein B0H12DRAFT_1140886 [Mycena haematopus]